MTHVGSFRDVAVYVHWSALVIAAIALLESYRNPLVAAIAILSFAGLMLLHEIGHAVMAQRMRSKVYWIHLFPIHGQVCYEQPWSEMDDCLIAWGGVLAQFSVAIPIFAWMACFGYPKSEPLTVLFVILAPFNAWIAAFNLLPVRGLDGSKAWRLMPLLAQRWWGARRRRLAPKSPAPFRRW
jgi:Zn-dependent protease